MGIKEINLCFFINLNRGAPSALGLFFDRVTAED